MANERDSDRNDDITGEGFGGGGRQGGSDERVGGKSEENIRGTADDMEDDEFDDSDDLDDVDDDEETDDV
jgi:hypothetical protein